MTGPVIGFAGMTHLGVNHAVAAAERGFLTVGFDPNESVVAGLNDGKPPVTEPDLTELLAKNADRLTFSTETGALKECNVIYVAPDVPTNDRGESDLTTVRSLIDKVAWSMNPDAVLVVLSQVPPGFTRGLGPVVKNLYYQVETLIFGEAVSRALHPERFIVGCADPDTPLPSAFSAFLEAHNCPILPMRYESAELAKISINCCLVAHVSVANTLADLCERVGADWSEIVPALRLDKRIGADSYIKAGLGIAGGNLERDLATVSRLAYETGSDSAVIDSFIDNSAYRKEWVLRILHSLVLPKNPAPAIGILGLAYKQNTHSIKNSAAVALLGNLSPFAVKTYDPEVKPDSAWHGEAAFMGSAIEACTECDVVAVMTPWDVIRDLSPAEIAGAMKGRILIDPFGVFAPAACREAGLQHVVLGAPLAIH